MVNQTFEELDTLLAGFDQQQLLGCWDQLDDSQRSELAAQITSIDFEQLTRLLADEDNSADLPEPNFTPPPAIRLHQPRAENLPSESIEQAIEIGEAAIRAGRVAMILVAGGQGTRLGLPAPKGLLPLGSVSSRTLLQFSIDRLRAMSDRYQSDIPLLIMTSPAVHEATIRFLEQHDYFGLAEENCRLFCQGTMPVADMESGKLLLETAGSLATSPDGHGGMLEALDRSGCLADLARRQIDVVFYAQVDNPLAQVCDPGLIGFHLAAQSEMTSQVVEKKDGLEKTGNIVAVDGHLEVVEYSELPESLAHQTLPDGTLRFWAGSIAVHIFSRALLDKASRQLGWLPFHKASKQVAFVDGSGRRQEPAGLNALKFERFIFDLLPRADNALVVEVDRAEAFAPVKNPDQSDTDTAATAQQALLSLHRQWLLDAGVKIDEDVPIEIHPSWAITRQDVLNRGDLPTVIDRPTLLSADDEPGETQD
jgi:UDP-N-acetylglucosamine/UDP-N-acetylgalactosamine diphosphorylase